jgi:L-arabinokinase
MRNKAQAEAPGRLDVMGGVADYSGALVLETPIRATTKVAIERIDEPTLYFSSRGKENWQVGLDAALEMPDAAPEVVRQQLDAHDAPHWARYPFGCLWALSRAKGWRPESGLRFSIRSTVPESMGVSSSAALEVATLRALGRLADIRWSGTELARLGQQAENEIVGAPCGLMDQLTAEHGKVGALLPILCRPDELRRPIPLPRGAIVVGWPSGVQHAVSGSPYATARAAAFMGKKILERETGHRWPHAAEIAPSFFERHAPKRLPESISGAAFRERYGEPDDSLTRVVDRRRYGVYAGLRFPILESFRCELATAVLSNSRLIQEDRLRQVGELMLQSHAGYGSIGLGAPETDQMVDALLGIGPDRGVYGARVSGGGSGGTVVVLLRSRALPDVQRIARQLYFGEKPLDLIR